MTTADATAPIELEPPKDRPTWSDRRPTALLSRLLGISRGEAATVVVALVIALVLTIGGLPPVLRQRGAGSDSSALSPSPLSPAPSPTVDTPEAPTGPAVPVAPAPLASAPAFSSSPSFSPSPSSSPPATSSGPRQMPPPAKGTVATFAKTPASPYGLAIGGDGTVFASTTDSILSFAPDGSPAGEIKVAGVSGLAFEGDGVLTAAAGEGRIVRIDVANGSQSDVATLLDLPACQLVVAAASGCEPGVEDGPPLARGLAYDSAGTLYVTDASQGTVWRIKPGAEPEPWAASNQWARGTNSLAAIVVEASGSLLVASPQALDPASPGGGGVYRIAVNDDGSAGEVTLVYGAREEPTGLAVLSDGSFIVSTATSIIRVGADGTAGDTVTVPELHRPSFLAFLGQTLLAANTGTEEAHWALLAVGI